MRTEFGLSARQVFTELPEWELNVLLGERERERREAERQQKAQGQQ
jgi:hypothetical protein